MAVHMTARASRVQRRPRHKQQQLPPPLPLTAAAQPRQSRRQSSGKLSLWRFAQQALSHRNFLRFIAMDSILEAENIFQNQFRQTLIECLLHTGTGWTAAGRATLLRCGSRLHALHTNPIYASS